jgi:hypothetical protein
MDKEDYQISSSVCLPKRSIDVFARTMSLFSKAEVWEVGKDLFDLLLLNTMLLRQFFIMSSSHMKPVIFKQTSSYASAAVLDGSKSR